MELIGDFASLGLILCALLAVTLIFAFFLSIPGWLIGRIAAPSAPRLTKVRKTSTYWATWVVLGGLPLMVSILGGPFAGGHRFIPTAVAVILAIGALIVLNVNAFMLGYKQGLATKAKKDISKRLKENLGGAAHAEQDVDWLDPDHPAIASTPGNTATATAPLPVVDAYHPIGEDAPTQESAAHGSIPLGDEYPTARPRGY